VDKARVCNASCAKIPVWAIEALVTDTIDVLVTSIANSVVASVAAWSKQSLGNKIKLGILNSRSECMLGVVAMLQAHMARNTEIIVITGSASDEVLFCKFCSLC
jgi:hypothetical protein